MTTPEPHTLVRAGHGITVRRTVLIRELPNGVAIADQMGARSGEWLRRTVHDHFTAAVAYYRALGYDVDTEHTAAYVPRHEDRIPFKDHR